MASARTGPVIPKPVAVSLPASDTSVLVLDLSGRCDSAGSTCGQILPAVRHLVDRARAARARIAFTISSSAKGTEQDHVSEALALQDREPTFYPDHFDKLVDGELVKYLDLGRRPRLLICGSATNNCVMYTATTAARVHRASVYLPVDCVNARSPYEHEYALHQLSHLRGKGTQPVTLTHSTMLRFGQG